MRNTSLLLLALSVSLFFADPATAQTRFGLGVGIGTGTAGADFDGLGAIAVYVPIHASSIRIEPEVGLLRVSSSDDDFEQSTTILQLGSGFFANLSDDDDTAIYIGGRLGIQRFSASASFGDEEEEESVSNFFIGPAVGGEHFLGDNFSLGGEARLIYLSFDEEANSGLFDSALYTNAVFFVRWYLN